MTYWIRTDDELQLCKAASGQALAAPVLTLFNPLSWSLRFRAGDTALDDITGITGQLVVKPDANYEGEARLIVDLTDEGNGVAALSLDSVDSEQLREDLAGRHWMVYWAQIRFTLPGSEEHRCRPFALKLWNSPARPSEEAPTPASDAGWEALKARLAAGANITLTPNNTTKVLTIAAVGYTGPTMRTTGNVLEVYIGGAWRQVPTLDAGSL